MNIWVLLGGGRALGDCWVLICHVLTDKYTVKDKPFLFIEQMCHNSHHQSPVHVRVHNHAGAHSDFVLPFPEPGTAGGLLPKA